MELPKLNLPEYALKLKQQAGQPQIFDEIRKKYVALTPEEWVRQHILQYLILEKHYPKGLWAIEKEIRVGSHTRRCDGVIYNREGQPLLIVECKAPSVTIGQDTFNQISLYNFKLHVKHLLITNGLEHYCCRVDFEAMNMWYLNEIPDYSELA